MCVCVCVCVHAQMIVFKFVHCRNLFPLLFLFSLPSSSPSSFFLQIFSGLMTLRKLCNHPDLVTNDFSELVRNEKGEGEEGEEEEEAGDFEILNVPGRKKKKWLLQG